MNCEECGKECEELFSKTKFNGNMDTRDLCKECFVKVHEEEFQNE